MPRPGKFRRKLSTIICQTKSDTKLFDSNVKQRTALHMCVYSHGHKYTASSIMHTYTFVGLHSYCVLDLLGLHVHTHVHTHMPANKFTICRELCMHKYT